MRFWPFRPRVTPITDKQNNAPTANFPSWQPATTEGARLVSYANKVAEQSGGAYIEPLNSSHSFWTISLDVHEAVWWWRDRYAPPTRSGSIRNGWSDGIALLLSFDGHVAQADWSSDFDPFNSKVHFKNFRDLDDPKQSWSLGNRGEWRDGPGRTGVVGAVMHFRSHRNLDRDARKPDWLGTSLALTRFIESRGVLIPQGFRDP